MILILFFVLSPVAWSSSGQTMPAFMAMDLLRGRGPLTDAEVNNETKKAMDGITYPNLTIIPENLEFSCEKVHQPGYYVNVEPVSGCQVYHRCEIGLPLYTYLCPVGKLFNQITLNCDYWFNVQCRKSQEFYDYSNPRLYLGPNVKFLDNGNNSGVKNAPLQPGFLDPSNAFHSDMAAPLATAQMTTPPGPMKPVNAKGTLRFPVPKRRSHRVNQQRESPVVLNPVSTAGSEATSQPRLTLHSANGGIMGDVQKDQPTTGSTKAVGNGGKKSLHVNQNRPEFSQVEGGSPFDSFDAARKLLQMVPAHGALKTSSEPHRKSLQPATTNEAPLGTWLQLSNLDQRLNIDLPAGTAPWVPDAGISAVDQGQDVLKKGLFAPIDSSESKWMPLTEPPETVPPVTFSPFDELPNNENLEVGATTATGVLRNGGGIFGLVDEAKDNTLNVDGGKKELAFSEAATKPNIPLQLQPMTPAVVPTAQFVPFSLSQFQDSQPWRSMGAFDAEPVKQLQSKTLKVFKPKSAALQANTDDLFDDQVVETQDAVTNNRPFRLELTFAHSNGTNKDE